MSRFACQPATTNLAGASIISAASGTDNGFGTVCGSFGPRSAARAGHEASPRRSRKRMKPRTTERPRDIELRCKWRARSASQARETAGGRWGETGGGGGPPPGPRQKKKENGRDRAQGGEAGG